MILHVMILDKFLPPFIDFVDKHFGRGENKYVFITSEKYFFGLTPEHDVEFLSSDQDIFITLLNYMKESRKIILHGLWRDKVDLLLINNPILFPKTYWAMWGGDFYFPEKQTENRKLVIKNIANLITGVPGDIDYVRYNYDALGYYHSCFMYTSNIFTDVKVDRKITKTTNILVGNSAGCENNHVSIFRKLLSYIDEDIKIFVPLSYGDKDYAETVIKYGEDFFSDKFVPLTKMLPLDIYLEFLKDMDIAIFNHKRQQAIGNTISLLGFGKKVYMRSDVPQWDLFKGLGINVFDMNKFTLSKNDKNLCYNNISLVKEYFSESNLVYTLKFIFDI